jgi:hypothetical protein
MMRSMLRERVFLGGQAVSMFGDGLALLAVPLLTLLTVAVAWFAGLQREDRSQAAVSLTGK